MGIIKSITNDKNMVYSYHKIGAMQVDKVKNKAISIEVLSYKDKESRDAEFQSDVSYYEVDLSFITIAEEGDRKIYNTVDEFNYSFAYDGINKCIELKLSLTEEYDKTLLEEDIQKVYTKIMELEMFDGGIEG